MMGYVLENPDRSRRSRPKPSIAVMLSIIAGSIGLTSETAAAEESPLPRNQGGTFLRPIIQMTRSKR